MTAVLDYRSVLEEKLGAGRSELESTQENLKKYSLYVPPQQQQQGNAAGKNNSVFRNRLGPPAASAANGSSKAMAGRLGPKVTAADKTSPKSGPGGSVLSRVIVEQKSRDEALAQQQKTTDKQEKMRNRRMFGSIMGTLQTFVRDENRGKEREMKKREIEKKIEQRTEEEKEEAIKAKTQLFEEKRRKEREIKALQLQMRRVEDFETWEASKRVQQGFIRTKSASNSKAPVFYLPKEHNRTTTRLAEETWEAIDAEVKLAKEVFEEELLRINARIDNPKVRDMENTDEEAEDEDNDDLDKSAPSTVVVMASTVSKPEEQAKTADVTKRSPAKRNTTSKEEDKAKSPAAGKQPEVAEKAAKDVEAPAKADDEGEKGIKRKVSESGDTNKKEEEKKSSPSAKRVKKSPGKKRKEGSGDDSSSSSSSDSDSSDSSSDSGRDNKKKKKKPAKKAKKQDAKTSRKR